jgi:glutaredoxin
MLDKKTISILFGVLAIVAGLVFWGLRETKLPTDDPNAIVYYYGEGCPHCKVVSEFLSQYNIADKISFEKKEVWGNKANASEMQRRAKICGIQPEGMGVPFVYAAGKCFIGEPDVKKFFAEKANINIETPTETQK